MSETSEANPIVVMTGNQSGEVLQKGEIQNIQSSYGLNGKNYLQWSQVVKTFLKGKGKLSHSMNTGPAQNDPTFVKSDNEDSIMMSWLWKLMLPKISGTCMFLITTREIW